MIPQIISDIRRELTDLADPLGQQQSQRFFKEAIKVHGLKAAAVSLIIPARKGLFLDDIFEIADSLLSDNDDLVQKGYGWMLKAASESHMQTVFEFVLARKNSMPRTALRYAIEKMPPQMRQMAMTKA